MATGFAQQEPVEGGSPSQPTEIRVLYSDTHLYIGAALHHDRPAAITASTRQRDAGLGADDRLMWILDPYNDGRSAYFFETNPLGLRGDGLLTTGQGSSINKSWDGVWDVAVSRSTAGWQAEIRIPFRTLQFKPGQSTWGFNVQRTIRARNEEILWTGYARDKGLFRPRFSGHLTGLTELSQGIGLDVIPYGLGKATRSWTGARGPTTDPTFDVGGDLSYAVTPTLLTALSVNTDFAEVEVDQRRVNLTRFPLFFPEQRDFFLASSDVFTFAPSSNQNPFFSRRIGLVDGEAVPILAGARLNGRVGRYAVGLFQVRTRQTSGVPADSLTLPAEDFTAARVVRTLGPESQVGVLYTRRATHADPGTSFDRFEHRHTLGTDLELGTSRFLGNQNLQFQAFVVGHTAPLRSDTSSLGNRTTRGLRINYPNDPWSGHVSYREFGTAYDPAVGFVSRRGFRRLQPSVGYEPFLEQHSWIRNLEFGVRFEYLTALDLQPLTVQTGVQPFGLTLESGDSFEGSVDRLFERLEAPFDLLGDGRIVIAPGTYTTHTGTIELRTADFRPVSGDVEVSHGGFWSGLQTEVRTAVSVRPWAGITLDAEWEYSALRFDAARATTHVLRLNGTVAPTPDVALSTRVQFDNVSDRLGLFARLRWIPSPGNDLFLVLTQNWRHVDDRLTPTSAELASKLTYSVRF